MTSIDKSEEAGNIRCIMSCSWSVEEICIHEMYVFHELNSLESFLSLPMNFLPSNSSLSAHLSFSSYYYDPRQASQLCCFSLSILTIDMAACVYYYYFFKSLGFDRSRISNINTAAAAPLSKIRNNYNEAFIEI